MNLYKISLFILLLTTWIMAGQWIIDTLPTSGYNYSMVIDSNGVPVIGYSSGGVSCAKYMSGYGWLMQSIDSGGYAYSSNERWLFAGKNGSLHAAYEYYNSSYNYDLKYTKWNGITWINPEAVTSTALSWLNNISIVADSNDNPHIIYDGYDGSKYTKKIGGNWSEPSSMPTNYFNDAGLAIDGANTLHTAYYTGSLYYAKKDASSSEWSTEVVANEGGWNCSIAVGPSGMIAIAYQTSSNEDVKCAIKIGSSWQIYNVDVGDEKVGYYISVAIDSISNVHIAYNNYSFDDLKYAKFSAGTWNIQTVDSVGKVGDYCSIAINNQNNPCIAYEDETNNKIKYAYWLGGSTPPTTTGIPVNIKLRNNSFKPEKGEKMEIEYELFQPGNLKINIYNLKNELIKTIINENKTEGKYSEFWEGINSSGEIVGSGLYFVVVEVGSGRIVKKAVVIK